MSITVKPYLLKRRKKANGLTPIYIRITQFGKYSLLASGIDVEAGHWDPKKGRIRGGRTGHPSAKALNFKLQAKIHEIDKMIEEAGEEITRKQLVQQLKNNSNGGFYAHAETFYNQLLADGKLHPYKQTKSDISKLKQFAGNSVRFDEITPYMLNEFQRWMQVELDNHPNTIIKTIGRIKAIMNDAYEKDLTKNLPFQNPKYKPLKRIDSKKKALSIAQIDKIEALDLEEGSDLWHTRNYFMFSFWNAGIRFTDLAFLKWSNIIDGRLIYRMSKNGKEKNIKLLPQAIEILDCYEGEGFIFPILPEQNLTEIGYKKKAASQNVIINRNLKEIQRLAGIGTTITFHISRHSFARWADSSGVMDRKAIMNALAHSKMSTTETYLDGFNEYHMDEGMKRLAEQRGK